MKIKRILSGLLCGVIFLSLLTACSNNNSEPAKSTPDTKAELMHDFVVRALFLRRLSPDWPRNPKHGCRA